MSRNPKKVVEALIRTGEFCLPVKDLDSFGAMQAGKYAGTPSQHVATIKKMSKGKGSPLVKEMVRGVLCYVPRPVAPAQPNKTPSFVNAPSAVTA